MSDARIIAGFRAAMGDDQVEWPDAEQARSDLDAWLVSIPKVSTMDPWEMSQRRSLGLEAR